MKAELTRWGPRFDYRGAQVALQHERRVLLGEIVGVRYDEIRCGFFATVRHFNGERWPFDPALVALDILDRSWPEREER